MDCNYRGFGDGIGSISLLCVAIDFLWLVISGTWIANLTALAKYHTWLVGSAIALIAVSYYLIFRRSKVESAEANCRKPSSGRPLKGALRVAVFIIAIAAMFPFMPSTFTMEHNMFRYLKTLSTGLLLLALPSSVFTETGLVTLQVEHMNCIACPIVVKQASSKLDDVTVSMKNKTAVITYEKEKLSEHILAKTVTDSGFPSKVIKVQH